MLITRLDGIEYVFAELRDAFSVHWRLESYLLPDSNPPYEMQIIRTKMLTLLSVCLMATHVSAVPMARDLGKTPLESGLTYLDQPFWDNLHPTNLTSLDIWEAGWLPQACLDQVNSSGKCAATNMEVYDVYYTDVSSCSFKMLVLKYRF